MTHPTRRRHAELLRNQLTMSDSAHGAVLDARIVVDPAPDQPPSARRTSRLAWQAVEPDATHHLVLQDDAVPCASFVRHLRQAIEAQPDRPLSLHTEWGSKTSYAVRLAALLGASWTEVVDHYVPDIALVLPAPMARRFGQFTGYTGTHSDEAVREFLATVEVSALMAVPNLVQHAPLPSVVGHGYMGERPSACFRPHIGDVDWHAEPVVPRALPVVALLSGHAIWIEPAPRPGHTWPPRSGQATWPEFGLSPANVANLGRATVRPWSAALPHLAPTALPGLWLTAFGLGALLADTASTASAAGTASLDAALARPTARCALATMPGGALRMLLGSAQVGELAGELLPLVERAVGQGHDAVRNVRGYFQTNSGTRSTRSSR